MSHPHTEEPHTNHSCGCGSACGAESIAVAQPQRAPKGIPVFRIPTMDCAAEEGEIRHALAKLPGLRSLSFQLGARTLAIDAPAESIPQALEAIRKAGFKPVPLSEKVEYVNDLDHTGHNRPRGHNHPDGDKHGGLAPPEGVPRYVLALVLAFGAESISFFAPHSLTFSVVGMAISAAAIGLAGFSTYVN